MSDEEAKPETATQPDAAIDDAAITGDEASTPPSLIATLRKKLKIIIIAVIALVAVGGGGYAYYIGFGKTISDSLSGTPNAILELPGPSIFHELPEMVVDLKPTKQRKKPFIKFVMTVELTAEEDRARLVSEETRLLDGAQTFLRANTVDDLSGREGSERLRQGMVDVVNSIIAPNRAVTVLFKEILVR